MQEKKVGEPKSAWALPYCVGMSHLAEPSCLGNAMKGAFKKGGIYEIGQQKGSSGIPCMTHNLHKLLKVCSSYMYIYIYIY